MSKLCGEWLSSKSDIAAELIEKKEDAIKIAGTREISEFLIYAASNVDLINDFGHLLISSNELHNLEAMDILKYKFHQSIINNMRS